MLERTYSCNKCSQPMELIGELVRPSEAADPMTIEMVDGELLPKGEQYDQGPSTAIHMCLDCDRILRVKLADVDFGTWYAKDGSHMPGDSHP